MSVIVETSCPKCKHISWAAEMIEDSELQHCARCKESFVFSTVSDAPIYFYEEALVRLAIWKEIRKKKKTDNFFKRLAKRLKF